MKHIDYFTVYEKYIVNNEPIPYKDLLIYPVLWGDSIDFFNSCDILTIDKDSIPNVDIIQMSYLQFLLCIAQEEKDILDKLSNIFNICLHLTDLIEIGGFKSDGNGKISIVYNDIEITDKEFDEIRRIIMYQNCPNYDDIYIDPDVKKNIDMYYKIKQGDIKLPTMEDKKSIIMTIGFTFDEIKKMTYREAELLVDKINDKVEYTTNKIISAIPYIDGTKINVDNWIFKKKKDKYEDIFVDAEVFKNKFKNVT